MKLFTSILDDAKLLDHFLRHYEAVGIGEFYIAAPSSFANDIEKARSDHRITHFATDLTSSFTQGSVANIEIRALRSRYQRDDEWVVIVDLDEFIAFPTHISTVIRSADEEKANVVRGIMYDRFRADGKAADFEPGADLAKCYPVKTRFIRDVMLGRDHKAVLVKGHLKGRRGVDHHDMVGQKVASGVLEIDHYKWTAGSVERLKARCVMLREAGTEWSSEYERVVEHYETHGRFAWELFGGQMAAVE
jgi:Glycosyl transferase family 2